MKYDAVRFVFGKRMRVRKWLIARCQAVSKLDYGGYVRKDDQPKCIYFEDNNCSVWVVQGFALQAACYSLNNQTSKRIAP